MAILDLKPLTKETIHEMGHNNHDLWLVKIDGEISGPYDAATLKEYASHHEEHFDEAEASRADTVDYQPFWSYALFQRRSPQVVKSVSHKGQFWILDQGQKQGPFSYQEIDKKLEMGLLSMTEHVSPDDGHTWKKIYEIEGLDRRSHTVDELPQVPQEVSFQKAKLSVISKLESPHQSVQDDLAELAHETQTHGKVLTLKLDELTLQNLKTTEVSSSFKWALPGVAGILVTVFASGYFLLHPSVDENLVTDNGPVEVKQEKRPQPNPSVNIATRGTIPQPQMPSREPASNRYPEPEVPASRFPTRMETHKDFEEPYQDERDNYGQEAAPAPREESLISGRTLPQDDESLDGAMNGVVQPVEPIIEESSDF